MDKSFLNPNLRNTISSVLPLEDGDWLGEVDREIEWQT